MRTDVIIAIDPDVKASGVAVLDIPKRSVEARVMPFPELLEMLRDVSLWSVPCRVIVEGGWLVAKSNYHYARGKGGERIAKNVGANHETGRKIVEMLEHWGIQHEVVHPLKKCWRGRQPLRGSLQECRLCFQTAIWIMKKPRAVESVRGFLIS